MASRAETVVLVALVEDVLAGRTLHDTVGIDGATYLATGFLSGLRSADLIDIRKALGLRDDTSPEAVAKAYDARRRAGMVDKSRPFLDATATLRGGGDVLLHMLADRLSRGGAIPARVHPHGDAEPVTLRAYLDTLAADRMTPATLSGPKLGLEAGASVMVAAITVRGKLERAGLLAKSTVHPALAQYEKRHA